MNVLTTNLSNNQLKITFLFSALLHVVGFYILSGISFNQTSRSPDIVPIKVTTIGEKKGIQAAKVKHVAHQNPRQSTHSPKLAPTHVEKKGIQAVNVKHVTQQSPRQSTQSPKLAPTTLNEVFDSKPTLIHTKNNLTQPSKIILQAKFHKDIGQLTLASSNRPSPSPIEHQRFFTKGISTAMPKPNHKNRPSHQNKNISATPAKFIEPLSKSALLNHPRAHSSSKVKVDAPKNFNPVPLYQGSVKKKSRRFIPNVRNVSLAHGFTERPLDPSQTTAMGKIFPHSKNSSGDVGELRRGFHGKIWQRVAKVKYYPRMARKRGFEGNPVVAFTLGKKGDLVDLKIIEASNYDLLNEAALETIRRGIPYPPIPEPLGKSSISFNLPISYVLER
jgi:TonB family protein